ncbi:MAG: hypothetical protein ACLFS1_07330 [Opitutales bacterium]
MRKPRMNYLRLHRLFCALLSLFSGGLLLKADAPEMAWPAKVEDHAAPEAGEHPRLFFREADLPVLRARAQTPEGQAILRRLKVLLGGGETMPEHFRPVDLPFGDKSEPVEFPVGTYSIGHAAGFGLLYQLTGEQKYADLGRECFEWAFQGIRDRDIRGRYGWVGYSGDLRAGPTLGWYALGYDLLYDGWDPDFRKKVARKIQNFNQDGRASFAALAGGASHVPRSNHWGMQVGGAALALLAIYDDPGVDRSKLKPLVRKNHEAILKALRIGFGDGGFFAEGDGTGSMASHIALLPALQAWKTAGGYDFLTPRPHTDWMAMRWMFLAQMQDGDVLFEPKRGGYPHNVWDRGGLSGAGYFAYGFGVVRDRYLPGMKWIYEKFFKEADATNETPFATASVYPQVAVLAFINYPFGVESKDPSETWPKRIHDTRRDFYAWRNRFRNENDVILSVLGQSTRGYMRASNEESLSILSGGTARRWGYFTCGILGEYDTKPHGGSVLAFGDGGSLGVDFSGRSGRDAMLVWQGPDLPQAHRVEAGGKTFAFLFLGDGTTPEIEVHGDVIHAGEQRISLNDGRVQFKF